MTPSPSHDLVGVAIALMLAATLSGCVGSGATPGSGGANDPEATSSNEDNETYSGRFSARGHEVCLDCPVYGFSYRQQGDFVAENVSGDATRLEMVLNWTDPWPAADLAWRVQLYVGSPSDPKAKYPAEPVRGERSLRIVLEDVDLAAGDYIIRMKPSDPVEGVLTANYTPRVDWNATVTYPVGS